MARAAADTGRLVYCGNLPDDVREREVEDLFAKYGRIRAVDLKSPVRPPAYAFIEFDDPRDAEDSVRGRDGYDFYGNKLRVELAKGGTRERGGPMPMPPGGFRNKGTGWRVIVKGLPMSASWQDLKDHFRKIVKPAYTNVFRDRGQIIGVVEFETEDDLDYAIRKLDDTEFKNPFDKAYVRLYDDSERRGFRGGGGGGGGGGGYRSRSRSRGRSPSRSPSRSRSPRRSRSRSPTRSPRRGASKSPSRSPARSRSPAARRSPSRSPARDASPRD
ncbi:hypothetical protein N2152v2_002145 [Parachlorella kessleri]